MEHTSKEHINDTTQLKKNNSRKSSKAPHYSNPFDVTKLYANDMFLHFYRQAAMLLWKHLQ